MITITRIAFLATLGLLLPVTTAHGQRCQEVSADGREVVFLPQCETDEGGIAGSPGAGVPFAAVPDWTNSLRLQIGGIRIADLNGDGHNDVFLGTYISSSFPPYTDFHAYIYFNTGSGLEATPSWQSTDTVHTTDVQIADINGDTYLDVFCANGGGSFSPSVIYWGSPTGPSTSPGWSSTVSPATWAVAAAIFDFDHDGDLDVVTTNQGISPNPHRPIYIYTNNAGVLSTTPQALGNEQSIQNSASFGDYNNDGWEDLAISKWVNNQFSGVYRNNAGVIETTQAWARDVSATDKGTAWADVDGNGWLDLAIGCDDGTQLFSNTGGTFASTWTSLAAFPSQQEIAFADVDNDGDSDLADTHFSTGRTHIYLNRDGVLDANPTWTYDATQSGSSMDFGDINGDGRTDLVLGFSGEPSVVVFYGLPPACESDLDGSGEVDVADLLLVITNWGAIGANVADVNGDSIVNVSDLLLVITSWGECP